MTRRGRRRALLATVLLLAFASIVVYNRAPGPVDERSLGYSVAAAAGGATWLANEQPFCRKLPTGEDDWECRILNDTTTTFNWYAISLEDDGGCWEGYLPGAPETGSERVLMHGVEWPARIDGCVRLADHFRPFNRLRFPP